MPGLILPADSHGSIAERVKRGDPTVGWRGDPTMDVVLDERSGTVEVHAFDSHGERYVACTVDVNADPGWRYTILKRLTEWDPRRVNVIDKFSAEQEAAEKLKDHRARHQLEERADRLAWGLRRTIGPYVDGMSREFY